jgi:MFS family permease
MSQEMFRGQITAVTASGFVGLFSLFNMVGRFFWSSTSDYLGRKNTYFVFFALGTVLYALVPYSGGVGSINLFVLCYAVIFSMYGGGFATVPAICATCSAHAMSGQSTYYYRRPESLGRCLSTIFANTT